MTYTTHATYRTYSPPAFLRPAGQIFRPCYFVASSHPWVSPMRLWGILEVRTRVELSRSSHVGLEFTCLPPPI